MQNQFQPEENHAPQSASLAAPQTASAVEMEAETQAAQHLTERLNEIMARAKRAKRRFWKGYILGSVCFISASFVISIPIWRRDSPFPALTLWLLGAGISIMLLSAATLSRQSPKFDADELARIGGVQAIPALFAALTLPFGAKNKPVLAALTTLLPQMKASDAHLLTPATRRIFHSYLANAISGALPHCRYDAFFVALLKALEQTGDSSAIPTVARLARMRGRTRRITVLRQAAIDCLPMLQANCGEVETARTLLRASHSEDARPDTLLRPASASTQTDAAELLRGADSASDDRPNL